MSHLIKKKSLFYLFIFSLILKGAINDTNLNVVIAESCGGECWLSTINQELLINLVSGSSSPVHVDIPLDCG